MIERFARWKPGGRWNWAVAGALLLTGCLGHTSGHRMSSTHYGDGVNVRFSPQAVPPFVSLVQQVVYVQGETKLEFTALVEIDDHSFTMAGISPLGNRLFLFTATETEWRYEAQMLFELPFPPKFLIRDFLLMYGDGLYLQNALSATGETVSDSRRAFGEGERIEVRVEGGGEWPLGKRVLENRALGYALTVVTVQVEGVNDKSGS